MRILALFGLFLMALGTSVARADDHDGGCHGDHCIPETKPVCFNIVCYYDSEHGDHDHDHDRKSCKASATFIKDVTKDGGEVVDDSDSRENVKFEVSCSDDNDKPLFNGPAHRYTDLLGTRIQGEEGPHPAITLPRGELHTGTDDHSGDHVSRSTLEYDAGRELERLEGTCYIWTGNP